MNNPQRFLACLVLGGAFAFTVGKSFSIMVMMACLSDSSLPFCGIAVFGRPSLERQLLQLLPLAAWAFGTLLMAGLLMMAWLRSERSRGARTDGVTFCSFALWLGALASVVSVLTFRIIMRVRALDTDASFDPASLTPLLVVAVTVIAAGGLWRMRPWGRVLTIVLGLVMSAGLVWVALWFPMRAPDAPLDASLVLGIAQWALITGYLLLPPVGRHFSRGAVAST